VPEVRYTRATTLLIGGAQRRRGTGIQSAPRIEGLHAYRSDVSIGAAWFSTPLVSTDKAAARTAYQDFFALWKNADPDIPILKQTQVGVREVAIVVAAISSDLHPFTS